MEVYLSMVFLFDVGEECGVAEVALAIFKECARSILDNKQYTEVPIELRKKIEDCFDNYLDQANIVIKGVTKADNLIPDPPRPQ